MILGGSLTVPPAWAAEGRIAVAETQSAATISARRRARRDWSNMELSPPVDGRATTTLAAARGAKLPRAPRSLGGFFYTVSTPWGYSAPIERACGGLAGPNVRGILASWTGQQPTR